MIRVLALALMLAASPLLAAAQKSSNSANDKSMILALESAWNQAEIHHDATAAAAIMADAFISVDHHGALQSKQEYLAGLKDKSILPTEIANSNTSVYRYGNVAIVTSEYRTKRHRRRQTLRPSRTFHRYMGKAQRRVEMRGGSGDSDPLNPHEVEEYL
jgi:ketosteroid isomerase-like protein